MIRKYEITDEDAVLEVWYKASLIAHHFVPVDFWKKEKEIIRHEYMPESETWVYEEECQIVGFISFIDDNTVGALFVAPAWQGQGIGTKLIDHAKLLSPKLFLDVFKQNQRSLHFYQKCGFEIIDESINPETGCEQFTMVWKNSQNIILTGFMGTGKSSVGRLLALEMDREFFDMDEVIEQRERRTINQIFADVGEPYFRQLEANLCRELSGRENLVIATGGGALVPEENLRVMESTGWVICLDCEPAVLWGRIGHSQNRPMLAEEDETRFARLAELLAQRAPAFERVQHHVDVTNLTREEAIVEVCKLVRQRTGG